MYRNQILNLIKEILISFLNMNKNKTKFLKIRPLQRLYVFCIQYIHNLARASIASIPHLRIYVTSATSLIM